MNFQKLDLNLLVALDAVLEERSVGRAADKLHVSQPTVSVALSKLREFYKDDLFVRDGRIMRPTPFAIQLSPLLHQFVVQTRQLANADLDFAPARTKRRFVLVMNDSSARLVVPGLLRRMREAAPAATLACLGISAATVRAFNDGEADLLLVPGGAWLAEEDRTWMDRHPSEAVGEERRACLAWTGNAAIGDPATLEQIQKAGVVIPGFASTDYFRPPTERPLRDFYGTSIRVVAEVSTSVIGLALVGSPHVAVVGQRQAAFEAKHFDLKKVGVPPELDRGSLLSLYSNKLRAGDPALVWFKGLLRDEIALNLLKKPATVACRIPVPSEA